LSELSFRLDVREPARRCIAVSLEADLDVLVRTPAPGGQPSRVVLFMPTWTPGSYLIREYSRHMGPVAAVDVHSGCPIVCTKIGKNRFAIECPPGCHRVRFSYEVYAHELTVRTADVTPEHAYWNHACVLVWPLGRPELPATIAVRTPSGWDVATSLRRISCSGDETVFAACNMDEAMDSPFLAGRFQRLDLRIRDVPHQIVLEGLGDVPVPENFVASVSAIVERTAEVFGGELPYRNYLFLCLFAEEGHGGLEHRDSTTLLSARTALRSGKTYQSFLGLLAHEFFHVWNVKRMRPEEFWAYDYETENYTSLLWLAEGFTAYYDDLICLRAGVLEVDDYLAILGQSLTTCLSASGRQKQSLSAASYDAWIRLYRPDENTRNSTQNYYVNGSLAALSLDLTIRSATDGRRNLDDALRQLYRATYTRGRGYRRSDVEQCLAEAAGRDLKTILTQLVDGPLDPDFSTLFPSFGLELTNKDRDKPYLGLSFDKGTTIGQVSDDGPAFRSGLAPGDEILALADLRVTADRWQETMASVGVIGKPLRVLVSSRGRIVERVVTPSANPIGTITVAEAPNPSGRQLALRDGWLGRDRIERSGPQSRQ